MAVKVLRPELAVAVGAERFLREITIAGHLQSPQILTLLCFANSMENLQIALERMMKAFGALHK